MKTSGQKIFYETYTMQESHASPFHGEEVCVKKQNKFNKKQVQTR